MKINKHLVGLATGLGLLLSTIPVCANEWTKTPTTINTLGIGNNTEKSKYYYLGLSIHNTWQDTSGNWQTETGKPGTTYTNKGSKVSNVKTNIAQYIPGLKGKLDTITNATVSAPLANMSQYKDAFTDDNFAHKNLTYYTGKGFEVLKNAANAYADIVNYPQSAVSFSNMKYDVKTDTLTYDVSYPLRSLKTEYGYRIDDGLLEDIADGVSITQAKENEWKRYSAYSGDTDQNKIMGPNPPSSAPTLGFNPIVINKVKATAYFTPLLYTFEATNNDPVIIWEPVVTTGDKVVCVQGKSGGIQFTVKNVKKEWLKLEGYLEFTDAEGKIPDWKVTHKVQYDEKSMFATRTNCIDYVPKKLKACYIPDPSKPNERYCAEFERESNDLGIGKITLITNNKGVSAPIPNQNHTTKIELVNLRDKVVKKK